MKLVQKEKQVVQLQAEVERLQAQNPTAKSHEVEERARRERDRLRWNKLHEEVTDLKAKVVLMSSGSMGIWAHIPAEHGIGNDAGLQSEGDAVLQAGTRVRVLSFLKQHATPRYRASREGVGD